MRSTKLGIFCTAVLLAAEMLGPGHTLPAQEQGIIQARALAVPMTSSLRAVAVVEGSADAMETGGIYETALYGGAMFRLPGLPLNRTLWIAFLAPDGRVIKTVATHITSEYNPLDLSIDFSGDGSTGGMNAVLVASGQASHHMALGRYAYTPADTLHIRYRAENLGQAPIALNFPSAQRYDFTIERGNTAVWRWSGDRMFAQTVGSVELSPGEGVTYEEDLALASLDLPLDARYTLRGRLTTLPSEAGELPPEMELTFFLRSTPSRHVGIRVGSPVAVDGISGGSLAIDTESPVDPLEGTLEILTHSENPGAPVPGYRFIQAVELLPEAALGRMVSSLKVRVPYDEGRLAALDLRESNIGMFVTAPKEGRLVWQRMPSEVDRAENRVVGAPEGFGSVGLFGVPGTGLIGDFNSDGKVGFDDFVVFARGYGKRAGELDFRPELDLDGDSEVGFRDFLTFAAHYGEALSK